MKDNAHGRNHILLHFFNLFTFLQVELDEYGDSGNDVELVCFQFIFQVAQLMPGGTQRIILKLAWGSQYCARRDCLWG